MKQGVTLETSSISEETPNRRQNCEILWKSKGWVSQMPRESGVSGRRSVITRSRAGKSFSKMKAETHLLELAIRKLLLILVTAVGTRYLGQEAQLQQVEELVRQLEILG